MSRRHRLRDLGHALSCPPTGRAPAPRVQHDTAIITARVQVVPFFVQQHGIAIIVKEATREGSLASSLMLVADVLRLFARSHFAALFQSKLVVAVANMLSFKTMHGADERHLDVDVKHAALMLVQMLDKQGEAAEVCSPSCRRCPSCAPLHQVFGRTLRRWSSSTALCSNKSLRKK